MYFNLSHDTTHLLLIHLIDVLCCLMSLIRLFKVPVGYNHTYMGNFQSYLKAYIGHSKMSLSINMQSMYCYVENVIVLNFEHKRMSNTLFITFN
jgi:hypothetical protein